MKVILTGACVPLTTEYGMPIFEPWYCPEPKSACMPTLDPMKLMMADEFGSTAAPEISWFQRLALLKGRNPLRLAPWPALIALQALWLLPPPEPLPPPLPPEPMLEPLSPPPQLAQARARASSAGSGRQPLPGNSHASIVTGNEG